MYGGGKRIGVLVMATAAILCVLFAVVPADAQRKLPPINIAHITDLHGWVFGHPHQPSLNADFGDFASLLQWLQAKAAAAGEEFFLFDSGDLIEGTGLSDATDIHGQYIFEVVKKVQRYTALTLGNHDVGHANVVDYMHGNFIPFWRGRLVTANTLLAANRQFLGNGPYHTFTTALGTKVLVLGYLYNFTQEAKNTIVVPVATSLQEPYFSAAMAIPDVDIIVVTAHIDPTHPTLFRPIYDSIRKAHPNTPLCLMAGHRHITYFEKYDNNSFVIESGKYFEVLGKIRFTVDPVNRAFDQFTYSWVNTTKQNFYDWSDKTASNFMTPLGNEVRTYINDAIKTLHLNESVGCSPLTYVPYGAFDNPSSLYSLYVNQIFPKTVANASMPNSFFITNDGTLRYDLYKGRVVMNDIYTINPFKDQYFYYSLNGSTLKTCLKALNSDTMLMASIHNSMHGRTPYRPAGKNNIKDDGIRYFFTGGTIQDNTVYTVTLAAYDATILGRVLAQLYPAQTFVEQVYPTEFNSTFALQSFVAKFMPCSASCKC